MESKSSVSKYQAVNLFSLLQLTIFLLSSNACEQESTKKSPPVNENLNGEKLASIYCGSCHLPPQPEALDKKTWSESVLPHMSWRLGIPDSLVRPPVGTSMAEKYTIASANLFPSEPQITDQTWLKIRDYFVDNSPLQPLPQQIKPNIQSPLPHFKIQPVSDLRPGSGGMTTMIKFNHFNKRIYLGNARGELMIYDKQFKVAELIQLHKTLTDIHFNQDGSLLLLSVGNINPNDEQFGEVLLRDSTGIQQVLLSGLRRPVDLKVADVDLDGKQDLIISEFGHQVGRISWHRQINPKAYESKILYEAPGSIETFIQDINEDNYPDIVALMAQGNEGVFAFLNNGNGQFNLKTLLRFSPVFGTSDMELIDFDGDKDLDIVLANGDNADYSHLLKYFHGIHLFMNNGNLDFTEEYFYPMYGATRLLAADFDLDGDIDIASSAFFPDLNSANPESFVFLENSGRIDGNSLSFQPFSFPAANDGRWMLMEIIDDGAHNSPDILLGSSTVLPLKTGHEFGYVWREKNLDFVLLKNIH